MMRVSFCRSRSKGASARGASCSTRSTRWCAARFAKDRMATFETYFVADKEARKEHKNPYFKFIYDVEFCRKVCAEFGVVEHGLIVNGHVPVKVEKGEQP